VAGTLPGKEKSASGVSSVFNDKRMHARFSFRITLATQTRTLVEKQRAVLLEDPGKQGAIHKAGFSRN
jgi:hypothetical protein